MPKIILYHCEHSYHALSDLQLNMKKKKYSILNKYAIDYVKEVVGKGYIWYYTTMSMIFYGCEEAMEDVACSGDCVLH